MAKLDAVLPALTQGYSVRRAEWEPIIRMFVWQDALMCQCGNSTPWYYSLGLDEIVAGDWQLVE